MTTKYYLPDYVYFTCEGDTAVFMDLRADRYSMLMGAKARAFQSLLCLAQGSYTRSVVLEENAHTEDTELRRCVVAELLENQLLVPRADASATPVPIYIPLPERSLLEAQDAVDPNVSARDVYQFITSCCVAKLRLTCASIESTVRAVEHRNRLGRTRTPFNVVEARRVLGIYNKLRPLFPKDFLCLYDSLSILEFLARYNCFPSWVFAVRLEPWTAHCWVQYEAIAFNQDVDEARSYLPLLSV